MARYRGARLCISRFHPASGTSTRNTALENSKAWVRSATTEPQTKDQASSGASPCGTRRSEFTTIFSNPGPACSNANPRNIFRSPMRLPEVSILALQAVHDSTGTCVSEGKLAPDVLNCSVTGKQPAFELSVFHGFQNFAEPGARKISRSDQIVAGD